MESLILEWLGLAFRWIHIITGIAWIGASFYFNWLLNHLLTSDDPKVSGQLWALHAGGFFNVEKRNIEPGQLPEPLHWFKWESYWTWISGFVMLVIVYYFGAEAYLIDPAVMALTAWQAIAISLATLAGSWLVYHGLWNSAFGRSNQTRSVVLTAVFIIVMTIVLTQVFSGRGAFLHVGAMLATWMSGNVFFVIMPAQRQLVQATLAGQPQNKQLANDAGQRSLHNNYLTLPVLFCMFSNHYPATFGGDWNWLILIALFAVGVLVRHYFNVRDKQGNFKAGWMLVVAFVVFIGTALVASYPALSQKAAGEIQFNQVQGLLQQHCISCHAAQPTSTAFTSAPKGVMLETEAQARSQATQIATQVSSRIMPLGNTTGMTEDERQLLVQWARQVQP
ncbi:MAG: urate hydroxylase PuuD [Candidatus Thiothrix sulfatifontis]|nr:MAG: urate hydroxylase PuuD [Candidatus Thiothrix sulfatifontis]